MWCLYVDCFHKCQSSIYIFGKEWTQTPLGEVKPDYLKVQRKVSAVRIQVRQTRAEGSAGCRPKTLSHRVVWL